MGDIGPTQQRYEVLPADEPLVEPLVEPVVERVPETDPRVRTSR